MAYATALRYRATHRVLKKYFGNRLMKDISYDDYQKFLNNFGAKHSKASVEKIHFQTGAAVKAAVRRELLRKNFTEGAELSGKAGKAEDLKFLEIEDMKKLMNYCCNDIRVNNVSKVMIATALYTGMRLAEVAGLTWNCVSFKKLRIKINKTYNYNKGGGFKPTKNYSSNYS